MLLSDSEHKTGYSTHWPLPVHSLDVHESRQVGADSDDVGAGGFVCSLDAAALPVCPVDVWPEQREAVRVLHWRYQRPPVQPVQIRRFDPLGEKTKLLTFNRG